MRDHKQLLLDSRAYAVEHRATSWWCLLSTLTLFFALQATILITPPPLLWLDLVASVLAGLVIIRMFIIYHDYEHGTILAKSRLAWLIMKAWGLFTLNPPSIWRRSHNYHHKHNSKLYGTGIGAFPVMTVKQYAEATPSERFAYHAIRHPLIFVFGYVTVFIYGMCVRSLLAAPRQHFDSAISLLLHAALLVALAMIGLAELLLCIVMPGAIAAMLGSYMFYAQHNFPGVYFQPDDDWDYATAALRSSSYMKMNPVMAWFTGNIGYHHVHHLNHHIPFYRLPEAMAELEELQSPGTTSLAPSDVLACLRLKLWDADQAKFVPFPPAAVSSPSSAGH